MNTINVNKGLICKPNGELVAYVSSTHPKEVPLADFHEGLAVAMRRRDSYVRAIENMKELLWEQERKVHKKWEESHGNE